MKSKFGVLPNGKEVYVFSLRNSNGIEVSAINYGGIITQISVPDAHGVSKNIVAGFSSLDDYQCDANYIGALVGRCANRINHASFELNSHMYQLSVNHGDIHHHGGICGFNSVYWEIQKKSTSEGKILELQYLSKDGEEGYPGNLHVTVLYILTENNEFIIRYRAISDKDTIVNLTQHSYFNLQGDFTKTIHSHLLKIPSNKFVAVDSHAIPTGEMEKVDGTPLDYRNTKEIGSAIGNQYQQIVNVGGGIDHSFVIDDNALQVLQLIDKNSGRQITVFTTEPGIHIYTGNFLQTHTDSAIEFTPYSAVAIETQHFPDSIHHPHFPSVVLRKNEEYTSETKYVFTSIK